MEYYGSTVGSVALHVVVEDVVAPECLAETLVTGACGPLLPVEPPEVVAVGFEGTYDVFHEVEAEFGVFECPGYDASCVGHAHVVAECGEVGFERVDAECGVDVERDVETVVVHVLDHAARVGDEVVVPCPA